MRNVVAGTVWDRSQSGATLFIEPHAVTAMVNQLDELRFAEAREIERILWSLTHLLDARREDILAGCAVLTHVDLTYAKARFSIAFRMCAVEPRADTRMVLRDARHPLLLHYARAAGADDASVVPISLRLGEDYDSIVITGPNTGGKTVALKTIGLLTLMAQCGMHLPVARDSCIPVTRAVYADIGDEQSLQQSLSTFSAHIRTVVAILAQVQAGALVLLDEVGAGTDPADGAALATALLEYLRQRGVQVVATTHLGALKVYASSTPRVENACVEFNAETMRPTYHLLIGQPGASNAIVIAQHLGMPAAVLDAARTALDEGAHAVTDLLNKVQRMRVEAEERRARADALQQDAAARMSAVEAERARVTDEAHLLVESTMRDLRALLDEYQRATASAPAPWADCARTLCKRVQALAQGTPLAEQQAQFAERVRVGDRVFVTPLQSYGVVRAIRRKRRIMRVEIENVESDVPFSGIAEKPFSIVYPPRMKPPAPASAPAPDMAEEPVEDEPETAPLDDDAWRDLQVGQEIYVPVLRSAATVLRIDRAQQRVTVRAGVFETVVPLGKVRWVQQ
jgi:dsDNA-specific endonuclease/ATPase MutS2